MNGQHVAEDISLSLQGGRNVVIDGGMQALCYAWAVYIISSGADVIVGRTNSKCDLSAVHIVELWVRATMAICAIPQVAIVAVFYSIDN